MAANEPNIDTLTGTATTGHEWDGLRELNTPLPRWWLWIFYATIVWAIGYWIVYPSWPLISSYTKGSFGWQSREAIVTDLSRLKAQRGPMMDQLASASLQQIEGNPQLLDFARAVGKSAFADNCAPCHGAGGGGAKGYPNLNDDDWLWGGKLKDIQTTITHGARYERDGKTRQSAMPRFLADGILKPDQIDDVAEYVLSFSKRAKDTVSMKRGQKIFAEQCAVCHGTGGEGKAELGAPRLNDAIWLYGGDKETIMKTVSYSRHGVMPAWGKILAPETIKQLTIYVHSLGGGK